MHVAYIYRCVNKKQEIQGNRPRQSLFKEQEGLLPLYLTGVECAIRTCREVDAV